MFKTLMTMLAGAIVFAIGAAFAASGTAPLFNTGYQLIDGQWLLGIAGGTNYTYQYGIVAHAGGGQASCTVLPPGVAMLSIDTVATSGDSICLPFATQGTDINFANNSSTTLGVYGQAANNPATGAADTINNVAGSTNYGSANVTTQKNVECFAPKNGQWRCVTGS